MSNIKKLSDELGIEFATEQTKKTLPAVKEQKVPVPEKKEEKPVELTKDANEDYNKSRKTFDDLINKGIQAVEELSDIARGTQHPRDYEVLAKLIETVSKVSGDLYDIHKKTKQLNDAAIPVKKVFDDTSNINIDKAVFVGTTSDLLDKLKNEK